MIKFIKALYVRLRFGKVTSEVRSDINGIIAEEAFYSRKGKLIGYWAYGYFDPSLPYRGL